jgi:hypothetical protein
MVPAFWVVVDSIPVSASGKADRKALPSPDFDAPVVEFEEPRAGTEQRLASIWREVLGVERVGRGDDFFLLGGHSILATRVASRIRRDLGVEVPLRRLFMAPTLARLAEQVDDLAAVARLTADRGEGVGEEVVL